MRNFGATASNFDQLRADIETTTCRTSQLSDKYDTYYDLLPFANKNPPKAGQTGRYWFYKPSSAEWTKYKPYWDARGWANTDWYINKGRDKGWDYVFDRGTIDNDIRGAFQAGGTNANNAYNICSYYIWWLFRTNQVHPDLVPFYEGNTGTPTIAKVSQAEKRWAENERKNLIISVLLKDFQSVISDYKRNPPQDGEALQNFIDKELGDLDVNNNDNWSQSLEDIGMGSGDKKRSVLPMVAVASFLTVGTFALLKWRRG